MFTWPLPVMIELDPSLLIGEGSHRATYRHPDDPALCLKVVKPGTLEIRRRNNRKWYKRLRPVESFDETDKDLKAYGRLKPDSDVFKHIPRFYRMVETSHGPAMLLERITNEDGSPSRPLKFYLEQTGSHAQLRSAILTLGNHLIACAFVIRDFHIKDVMVSERSDGTLRLYVVDGFGASELIPFSRIRYFARRTATRRVQRFYDKIMRHYPDITLTKKETP
jgi:hypothetical protein